MNVWGTFRGNEWGNKGEIVSVTELGDGIWGFEVKAAGAKEYLIERQGCQYLSILKHKGAHKS